LVEQLAHIQKVTGSTPVGSTKQKRMTLVEKYIMSLLQLQEYSENELVIQLGKEFNIKKELELMEQENKQDPDKQ
jgi:hypothetical protein